MKKMTTLFITIIMALTLTACGNCNCNNNTNSGARIYVKETSETNSEEPYVSIMSSSTEYLVETTYNADVSGYGIICSGKCYTEESYAVEKPLEICSKGNEVTITLANCKGQVVKEVMNAGDRMLMKCEWNTTNGYLYVVVN